jgi:hypothetical protein
MGSGNENDDKNQSHTGRNIIIGASVIAVLAAAIGIGILISKKSSKRNERQEPALPSYWGESFPYNPQTPCSTLQR